MIADQFDHLTAGQLWDLAQMKFPELVMSPEHLLGLIDHFQMQISPPQSRVHRNGGRQPGWGPSGLWSVTSFISRNMSGDRVIAYHESEIELALLRFICSLR